MSLNHVVDRYVRAPDRPSLVDTAIAVVAATIALAAFIGVASLVPSAWRFPGDDAASVVGAKLRQCETIPDGAARLVCYDDIAERSLPHPAKGANAPAAAFAGMHRDNVPGN
jgi:hypothetical protein